MNIKEFNTFNKSKFTRTCYDINSILKINTWRRGGWYSTIRFLIITNLRSRSIRCVSAESQLLKLGLLIFSIFLFYYILLYITYITVLLKVVGRFYIPWFWGSENTCFLPIEILHIPFLSISCLVYVNRIIVSQVSPLLRNSWLHSQIPNNQSYRV